MSGAGGGIRTHEPLRDEVLSLAPLTRLGDPRDREAAEGRNYNSIGAMDKPNFVITSMESGMDHKAELRLARSLREIGLSPSALQDSRDTPLSEI